MHCLWPFDWPNRRMCEFWSKVFGVRLPEMPHRFVKSIFLPPCRVSTQWLGSSKWLARGGRRSRCVHFCAMHSQCLPKTVGLLDAVAHLGSAPATPVNIKKFKSVTTFTNVRIDTFAKCYQLLFAMGTLDKDLCTLSVHFDTFLTTANDSFSGTKGLPRLYLHPYFFLGQQFCPRDLPRDHYQY